MTSRLKWVKATLRELIHEGRNPYSSSDIKGLKYSYRFTRLLYGKGCSQSKSTRDRRRAAPGDCRYKYNPLMINKNALKEAVTNLINRVHRGTALGYDYVDVLKGCSKQKDLESAEQVHDCIKKSGLEQNTYLANNLIKCYIGCGRLPNAQDLFNKLLNKDTVSWTIMIGGYAEDHQAEYAIEVFKQMRNEGGRPDPVTYLTILKAFASPVALEWGKEIHAQILHDGFQADVRLCNALVHMFAKCGSVDDARMVFDSMTQRDVITWTAMIGALAKDGRGHEAFFLFQQMQRDGVVPNAATYLSILNSNACEGSLEWVKEIHRHAARSPLNSDLGVGNALVHMYAKSGSIEDSREVFERMKERDIISWNAMIGGLAQHGLGHDAFSLFLQMQREGFTPDSFTYVNILNPCSSTGALEWVKEVHAHAKEAGLDVNMRVGSALIHMYAKIGTIADAKQVFDKMLERDVVNWTVMIGGLAQHGHGRKALKLFEDMKSKGLQPSQSLFVAVLSACSHAGLVDEGHFHFQSMTRDYGIEPVLEHFTCMVDILGRAGRLEEAKIFILNMPIAPSIVTWKAFLGACRIYNDVQLAELAAEECTKLEPMDPSPYVLLSHIYTAVGNWDQALLIRNMMQEKGIRKDPGLCWIEVDNKTHHFVAGDMSHPEARDIYALLNSLSKKMKTEGYVPDTQVVLRTDDEEGKESDLLTHSEKLAMAYGLMHVAPEKPIRIYKNLRMCTDCHTATKFISKITEREIVARDAIRFHHFKDGVCTCGDYW